ncbi:hypothetical protein YC2023_022311 [Brassica napus]
MHILCEDIDQVDRKVSKIYSSFCEYCVLKATDGESEMEHATESVMRDGKGYCCSENCHERG